MERFLVNRVHGRREDLDRLKPKRRRLLAPGRQIVPEDKRAPFGLGNE